MAEPNEGRRTHRRRRLWRFAAAAAAVGVAAGLGPVLLRGPAFVERVSFVNRGPYDIHVEVSGGERSGWMIVTTADKESTSFGFEIIDQGDIWVFRFRAQGREGGELRTSRAELQQAGWTVEIPEAVTARLRDAGAPPTP